MNVFEGLSIEGAELEGFFNSLRKQRGLLRRSPVEAVIGIRREWRPFLKVTFQTEDEFQVSSFVDESLVTIVQDFQEMLLLWRPKYLDYKKREVSTMPNDSSVDVSIFLERFLAIREECLERVMKLDEELRKIHLSAATATSSFIPRLPSTLRREGRLSEERRGPHGKLLAASLMANIPENKSILGYTVGPRVYADTAFALYKENKTDQERLLFLETAGCGNLRHSVIQGRALTRLCELNPEISTLFASDVRLNGTRM